METEINEVVSKTTELAVTIENFHDKIHTLEDELTESAKTSDVKKQELVVKISELESKLAESEVNANDLNEQISTKKAEAEEHALEQEKEREDLNENLTAYAEQLRVAREHESKLEQGAVRVDIMADRNQVTGPTYNDDEALQRIGVQDSASDDSPVVAHRALRVKHRVMWLKSQGRISEMLRNAEGAVGGAKHQSWSVDLTVGHEPIKANGVSMTNFEVIRKEGAVVLRQVDTKEKVNMNLEHNYDTANDLLNSDTVGHAPWEGLLLKRSARGNPTKVNVISTNQQDTALPCDSCDWRDEDHGDLHDQEHGRHHVDGAEQGGRMLKYNTMWRDCDTSEQVNVIGSEPIDTAQSCLSSVRREVVLGAAAWGHQDGRGVREGCRGGRVYTCTNPFKTGSQHWHDIEGAASHLWSVWSAI
jgi:hypothetical protein